MKQQAPTQHPVAVQSKSMDAIVIILFWTYPTIPNPSQHCTHTHTNTHTHTHRACTDTHTLTQHARTHTHTHTQHAQTHWQHAHKHTHTHTQSCHTAVSERERINPPPHCIIIFPDIHTPAEHLHRDCFIWDMLKSRITLKLGSTRPVHSLTPTHGYDQRQFSAYWINLKTTKHKRSDMGHLPKTTRGTASQRGSGIKIIQRSARTLQTHWLHTRISQDTGRPHRYSLQFHRSIYVVQSNFWYSPNTNIPKAGWGRMFPNNTGGLKP